MKGKTNDEIYWHEEAKNFAQIYKEGKKFSIGRITQQFLNERTRKLLNLLELTPDMSLLDVGCGSGVHMVILSDKVAKIVGVDLSSKMISMAEDNLEKSFGSGNWELNCCDASNLPFEKNSFECVISMGLLDYVTSIEQVIRQWHRVLKEYGYVVFTIPKRPSLFSPLRTGIGNFIKRFIFKLPQISNILSKEEVLSLVQKTGFTLEALDSIWTTMWIIKARKKV